MTSTLPLAQHYIGAELDIFKEAENWKNYQLRFLREFLIGKDVLEVGAVIGANTSIFRTGEESSWVCIEPDPSFVNVLEQKLANARNIEIVVGTLESSGLQASSRSFDVIIYMDVLEHIEDDRSELARAAALLKPSGRLVVLSPAHQWLFSEFDACIGHFRRYTRETLRSIAPPSVQEESIRYLDSVGLLLSLANRLLLKQSMPTLQQIKIWDTYFIPLSRIVDPTIRYSFGKSVLAVWKKR